MVGLSNLADVSGQVETNSLCHSFLSVNEENNTDRKFSLRQRLSHAILHTDNWQVSHWIDTQTAVTSATLSAERNLGMFALRKF